MNAIIMYPYIWNNTPIIYLQTLRGDNDRSEKYHINIQYNFSTISLW